MGLFDKLNEQLDINEYKSRTFNENELRQAEKMLFEGYSLNILEGSDKGWHSYYTWENKKNDRDFNKRITNPWKPIKNPEIEQLKTDKDNLQKQLDDKEAKKAEDVAKLEKNQELYDEQFEYLFKKHIATYKEYIEEVDTIKSSSLDDAKKKETIRKIKSEYTKVMNKIVDNLADLNRDKDFRNVRHHKLLKDVTSLDDNADTDRGYV